MIFGLVGAAMLLGMFALCVQVGYVRGHVWTGLPTRPDAEGVWTGSTSARGRPKTGPQKRDALKKRLGFIELAGLLERLPE